ncbi:hypothetical protein [Holdemanella biformis]|uniref:hypothetical protein n=1 Tax=Holdemanella biformis TaxID=1735 RepID=UPI00267677EC|nr:hypothetical protein [Holdemanella biformis]
MKKHEIVHNNKDPTYCKRKNKGVIKIMNVDKHGNVIKDINSLSKDKKELLEYEFVDRKPSRVYILDEDEKYLLDSLLLILDSNELDDNEKVKMIRESVLAIQSSFSLELYVPFNAIKIYTEYYVTNYKDQEKK